VSKYVDCYHVEYKLGLYCEAGWTGRQPAPEEAATHWDKLDQLIKAPVEAGELRAIVRDCVNLILTTSLILRLYTKEAMGGLHKDPKPNDYINWLPRRGQSKHNITWDFSTNMAMITNEPCNSIPKLPKAVRLFESF
jgi:hypothetical protein